MLLIVTAGIMQKIEGGIQIMEEYKLTEEEIKARRAYQKQWRDRNPDKAKQYAKRRWAKAAAKMAQETAANR